MQKKKKRNFWKYVCAVVSMPTAECLKTPDEIGDIIVSFGKSAVQINVSK